VKNLWNAIKGLLTQPTVATLIRAVFKGAGPLLAAKGWVDAAQVEQAAGAVIFLVGIVWGVVESRKKKPAELLPAGGAQ
jgi:hypothetical protein